MFKQILYLAVLFFPLANYSQGVIYYSNTGKVDFTSDAPLEMIKASSDQLSGALKSSDRSFAFSVPVKSFEGFNSSLQRTHFNENYLESEKFPKITFEGKIIEDVDLQKDGTHTVRGKGKFTCHGISQERIIQCKLAISSGRASVKSSFTVFLDDHNIKIPSVVNQKIAEEISVNVSIDLTIKR